MAPSRWSWIRRRAVETVLAAAALGSPAAPTSTPPATASSEVLFSASRRFALRTPDRARDTPLLALLEDLARRIEETLAEPLPSPPGRPWLVIVERGPEAGPPRAIREADLDTRGMGRTLRLVQPEELPPSVILVGIVAGMTGRHVSKRQAPDDANSTPRWAPEWFAAGLAGTLYPAPRQAWLRHAAAEWAAARDPPLDTLLAIEMGRADEHSLPFLTAFMAWLRRFPNFPKLADRILRSAATGTPMGPAELATAINPAWSARDLAQMWDLALAGLRRIEAPWAEPRERRIARLREAITLSRGEIPLALPPDTPVPLHPRDLVRADGAAWVPPLAAQMHSAMNRVPLGNDPDLLEIAADLRSVLAALIQAETSPLARLAHRLRRGPMLRRLDLVERRLDDLEAIAAAEATGDASRTGDDEVEALIRRDAALFDSVLPP